MFDDRLYKRGALTLHALRLDLGDEAFFEVLRAWTTAHRHGTATTADFIDLVASMTGRPVGALFEAWLFRPELPELPEFVLPVLPESLAGSDPPGLMGGPGRRRRR
jgi:aminopeptidase N